MAEQKTRAAYLLSQTHCPACGKPRIRGQAFGKAGLSAEVSFALGSGVHVFNNLDFVVSRECPTPMRVAVKALEDEFSDGGA